MYKRQRHARGLGADGLGAGAEPAGRRFRDQGLRVRERRKIARAQASLHHARDAQARCVGVDHQRGPAAARNQLQRQGVADPVACRRALWPWPAARCVAIFPHPARRRRTRRIEQAERRPADQVPTLSLPRHRRLRAPADHRGARHQAPAPGHGQFDGRHAHLDVGLHVSRPDGWARADRQPADRDQRTQLDPAPYRHRGDPQRPRLAQWQLQEKSDALRDYGALHRSANRERAADPGQDADPEGRRCALRQAGRGGQETRRQRHALRHRGGHGLQPDAAPWRDQSQADGDQLRRRRDQPAAAGRDRARDQAHPARTVRADPGERQDARPLHPFARRVLEGAPGRIPQGAARDVTWLTAKKSVSM